MVGEGKGEGLLRTTRLTRTKQSQPSTLATI